MTHRERDRYLFETVLIDVADVDTSDGTVWRCKKWHRTSNELHPLRIVLDYGMGRNSVATYLVCPVCFVVALADIAMFEHRPGTL